MSRPTEIDRFREAWQAEAEKTIGLLEALPKDQYDFRPDPKGRSIGEMAWHLSEVDACVSYAVVTESYAYTDPVPHLPKRPRSIELLAPGYRQVHDESMARFASVTNEHLDDRVVFSDGRPMTVRDVLWSELLHHLIHHRGQLALMCRMAGGTPPGTYGPNREEMQALMAKT